MSSFVLEEYELLGDSKYRNFVSQVDKALKSFDYTTEWADLISALGKLNRVLLAQSKYPIIPRRVIIGKRLAQCMHPALPSGVHLKALESYDIIFKCMGTNRLAGELFLYSAGLFPLLSHCSMSVRPFLLSIYESHFVPLSERLRPALHGFLSGILPALEEGTDTYSRINSLLDNVADSVEHSFFYEALWGLISSNPFIRFPALSFILSRLQKPPFSSSTTTTTTTVFNSLNSSIIIVDGLIAAVSDAGVLVQRISLELLIHGFPLHESKWSENEMLRLMTAASSVLYRRDSSLNRRFFNWITGVENIGGSLYFEHYAKNYLITSLIQILKESIVGTTLDLKPHRLIMTLLDKPEIGSLILQDIALELFRSLYHISFLHSELSSDLNKSANLLFSCLESSYIWEFLGAKFIQTASSSFQINDREDSPVNEIGSSSSSLLELSTLIEFLLDIVSLETYKEILREHLPSLCLKILGILCEEMERLKLSEILNSVSLCRKIISKFKPHWSSEDESSELSVEPLLKEVIFKSLVLFEIINSIKIFSHNFFPPSYFAQLIGKEKEESFLKNESRRQVEENILEKISRLKKAELRLLMETYVVSCALINEVLSFPYLKVCESTDNKNKDLPLWSLYLILIACFSSHEEMYCVSMETLNNLIELSKNDNTKISSGANNNNTKFLLGNSDSKLILYQTFIPQLWATKLWEGLPSLSSEIQVRAVNILYQLNNLMSHSDVVENVLAKSFDPQDSISAFQRFTLFWHLSRDLDSKNLRSFDICLYKMLDNLNLPQGPFKILSSTWLVSNLSKGDGARILEPLFLTLLDPSTARISVLHAKIEKNASGNHFKICWNGGETILHLSSSQERHNSTKILAISALSEVKVGLKSPGVQSSSSSPQNLMSLDLNPFALLPPGVDGYDSYTKGYALDQSQSHSNSSNSSLSSLNSSLGTAIAQNLLDTVLSDVIETSVSNSLSCDDSSQLTSGETPNLFSVHPLYSHMLLYTQVIDSKTLLYNLTAIRNILSCHPSRLPLITLSSSNLTSQQSPRSQQIYLLLSRHRKSIFGQGFSGYCASESQSKNSTLLEVLTTICLYYYRSYYPNLGLSRCSQEEIEGNRNVQLKACDILIDLMTESLSFVSENGKVYAKYLGDLLSRTKIQKIVLHSLLAGVHETEEFRGSFSNFTDEILAFNDPFSKYKESFIINSLRLLFSLVMVERVIFEASGELHTHPLPLSSNLKYYSDYYLAEQPMFLTAILTALRQSKTRHLHAHWNNLTTSCLPFYGRKLSCISLEVVKQLLRNLEEISSLGGKGLKDFSQEEEYIKSTLEALSRVVHYVTCDSSPLPFSSSFFPLSPHSSSPPLTNWLSIFFSPSSLFTSSPETDLSDARLMMLSYLPQILRVLLLLTQESSGSFFQGLNERLYDLFSPLATHHPLSFLSAVSFVWKSNKESRKTLVDFVSKIRSLPITTLILNIQSLLFSKSSSEHDVSALQFLFSYLNHSNSSLLPESWTPLSGLLKDTLSMTPPFLFLSLRILNVFVMRVSPLSEKRKEGKDVQDLVIKVIEAVATIGGSCLEQTTWLRRNYSVRDDLVSVLQGQEGQDYEQSEVKESSFYVLEAFNLLGDVLAPILDIIYLSDEKEKVLPTLYSVMNNVFPYLRHHSTANSSCFYSCSVLLANLSEYQYTQKAWRKEGMELLLDSSFFQMDAKSLKVWKNTIENMMTADKGAFKEFMTKMASISQSGSLSLFSSKDLELEQRALLLKRLSFVIFCSEEDQFQKQMPEIQERLAECLRTIPSSPQVQSAVFLCFRVILIRMSSIAITSLWPLIITEMVQIFSYLETELSTESEGWSSHLKRMSNLDSSWVLSAGLSGLAAHNSPAWLDLYLSVCKLLDLALALPAQCLPQFQMYRWAFVTEAGIPEAFSSTSHSDENGVGGALPQSQDFVPYIVRVSKLLLQKMDSSSSSSSSEKEKKEEEKEKKEEEKETRPLLTMTSISSLNDLAPFFASICQNPRRHKSSTRLKVSEFTEFINDLIERDFLENITLN